MLCVVASADLWRDRVLEDFGGAFTFVDGWKQTYQGAALVSARRAKDPSSVPPFFPGGGSEAQAWVRV